MNRKYFQVFTAACITAGMMNCCIVCTGQAHSIRFPSDRDNKIVLELNYTPLKKISLPVSEIEILDARYNQTYIGVTTGVETLVSNDFSRQDVIFPAGFSVYLNEKLSNWFDFNTSSEDKLVILVKKFRTSDNISKMLLSSQRKEVFFLLSLSFFLQRNNICYRLGGVDKWYSSDIVTNSPYTIKRDTHEWLITNVLIQEIQLLRFSVGENTVSFSRNDVNMGVRQRFDLPVMKQKIRKGIYRSLREFLNNQPADTSFKVATHKSGKIYFVDNKGQVITSANAWAVSDGMKMVYMFGSNFYEMELRGNSIRVKTFRKLNEKKSVAITSDLLSLGLISKRAKRSFAYSDMPDYLDVDMDSGELFLEEIIGLYKVSTLTEAVRKF